MPGLRERKKQATRDALSWAAVRLSVERGWDNVTVEDIADAANVSERTFRNYFSGKAEAVAARHLDRMRYAADALRERPAQEPLWDAIVAAVLEQFPPDRGHSEPETRDGWQWAQGVRLMFAEPALQGEIVKVGAAAQNALAEAVAERTCLDATRDVYPKLVAATVGAATSVAMEHSVRTERPTSIGDVLRDVLPRLPAGLPAP